ncbi:thymidylate synthase [Pantoea phage vB_PagM_SSEM1]|uniref:Thymidylate synthase n=1 Tax=Pantoea phage vB_PagM_SSEM1 TaxID=2721760 RepID=A0A6H0D9Q1_9CAUD|nr:thymidylate synthase [Pantoea phage vB_PagM_SSEM1]QIS79310.1 thymidylate synthase [Pantoea phage vB_PagM_SSEM1]
MSKQISAEVVDYMGTDLATVNAARVSYGVVATEMSERDERLIDFLAEHSHVTPFRHATVTLRCKAPIFLARQLGKHQVGFSWNEISRRYKDGESIEIECYDPEVIFARPQKLMTQSAVPMSQDFADDMRHFIATTQRAAVREYMALIDLGVAPEQARMVLPQGMITEWIWTGSLYGWASLYKQRSSEHAQYEARLFAEEVSKIMSQLFPKCWAALTK